MAVNKRERNLLILTVTLVVVGVNYFLGAYLVGKWRPLRGQLAAKQRELDGMQSTVGHEAEWRKSYEDLGHSLKQAQQYETPSDVLKKIEEVAKTSGVLMQTRRMLREEAKDVYRDLPVQCTFEADTPSLVKFLYGVQTAAGFMTVENLTVTSKADNSNILRCDIQVRALASAGEKSKS
jgi:Tfp pilus assembly protein PilO